jgi:hypothetical protein
MAVHVFVDRVRDTGQVRHVATPITGEKNKMAEVLRIRLLDRRRRDEWGGFPDPQSKKVAPGRSTFPVEEDSRFAESPIANFDDVVARIKGAKTHATLRQVLSELETARKEDVIEIARRVTGTKEKSTKQAVGLLWREWYLRHGTADSEWKEEEHPRRDDGCLVLRPT